jgi:cytochrome c-type biogenesis protein CcmE
MTRRQRRLYAVIGAMTLLSAAVGLVLFAARDTLVYFYSPTEAAQKHLPPDRHIRIGGLVEEGSVVRHPDGTNIDFAVTDLQSRIMVRYTGLLPDLFREGKGVIAEGKMTADGKFTATSVLAKHDENYMPPEVADALKKSGRWQEGSAASGAPAGTTR